VGGERVRFGVIGLDHPHVFGMTASLCAAGAELAAAVPQAGGLSDGYFKLFPDAPRVETREAVLGDDSIQLVVAAGVPDERAPLGLEAMRAGKDFLVDKPGFTTLEQLAETRAVQAETRRIYSVYYSERHESRATVRAAELVHGGAIGRVLRHS